MIKVVPKIIMLMELFSDGSEYSFGDVTRHSGLTSSNVSHLLNSLCESGVLTRTGHGYYRRGERLIRWCGGNDRFVLLKTIATRCADNVVGWINELGVVGLRHNGQRLTLIKRKPEKSLQVDPHQRRLYPADWYCTACGRILLAYADKEEVASVVRRCGLPEKKIWPQAITMPKLLSELDKIRRDGHVIFQIDEEVKVIGVPAIDAAGVKALSVSTALPVFSRHLSDNEIIEKLNYAAEIMSSELKLHNITVAELDIKLK